jgi:E3 ubiquitin-protein ligase UBR4
LTQQKYKDRSLIILG